MRKICFLLSFAPNPRMKKRISLLNGIYDVELIYWKKFDVPLYGNILPEISTYEIPVMQKNDDLWCRIRATLDFRKSALRILRSVRPDCIYVQNLDMLMIACSYNTGRRIKAKIVYEIADIYPLLIDRPSSLKERALRFVLQRLDRYYAKKVDILVNTSEAFYDEYYSRFIPISKLIILPNIPEIRYFDGFRRKQSGIFTVGFIGLIRYKEQMKMVIEAAERVGVHVFFAGSEVDNLDTDISIEALSAKANVTYFGRYNYETDIKRLYESVDAVYAVYDTNKRNVCIALPNKLYESIYCELPIIVAKGTYLAQLVEKWGVGIAVSAFDKAELEEALWRLSTDFEYYASIIENCCKRKKEINLQPYNTKLLRRIHELLN
jgi:succinoglycan biosynthesis protein ExoL